MAKETITINGKVYKAKEVSFNFTCQLGLKGLAILDYGSPAKTFPIVREYIAFCMGADAEYAGMEIDKHCNAGGNFNELIDVVSEKMSESGFFRSLNQGNEEETAETPATNTEEEQTEEEQTEVKKTKKKAEVTE
jgi:hypothetical protein